VHSPKLSIIVNHFNPNSNSRLETMCILALEIYKDYTTLEHEVILSDGSGLFSDALDKKCKDLGYTYLPSQEKMSFSESYNQGLRVCKGEYISLCANDIFICPGWDVRLIQELTRTNAWMAQPYLTSSDYPCQNFDYPYKRKTYNTSAMTFNLNIMTRECLEKVGLLSNDFSGCYNDSDYLIRIRNLGRHVITVDAGRITHLGKATTSTAGSSFVAFEEDMIKFKNIYPLYSKTVGLAWHDVTNPIFSNSIIFRKSIKFVDGLSNGKLRERLLHVIYRLEPILHGI